MLNVFGVLVFHRSMVNWRRGYICPKYMCIVLYVKLFGVVVFHTSMVNWRGSICHGYIYILLYVKHIGCNGVAWMYGQLKGRGVHLPWAYVHSICET